MPQQHPPTRWMGCSLSPSPPHGRRSASRSTALRCRSRPAPRLSSARPPHSSPRSSISSPPPPSPPRPRPSPAELSPEHRFRRSLRSGRPSAGPAPPRREMPPPRGVRRGAALGAVGERPSASAYRKASFVLFHHLYHYSLICVIIPPLVLTPISLAAQNKASSFLYLTTESKTGSCELV